MKAVNKLIDAQGHALMRDFGAFYPTGHMVVAFAREDDSGRVLRELLALGPEFADCVGYSAREMAEFAEQNLDEAGIIASFGASLNTIQSFLDAARQGASFLIIPTPDDAAAQRAMEVVHRVPFVLAQRYHRLAIEEMN